MLLLLVILPHFITLASSGSKNFLTHLPPPLLCPPSLVLPLPRRCSPCQPPYFPAPTPRCSPSLTGAPASLLVITLPAATLPLPHLLVLLLVATPPCSPSLIGAPLIGHHTPPPPSPGAPLACCHTLVLPLPLWMLPLPNQCSLSLNSAPPTGYHTLLPLLVLPIAGCHTQCSPSLAGTFPASRHTPLPPSPGASHCWPPHLDAPPSLTCAPPLSSVLPCWLPHSLAPTPWCYPTCCHTPVLPLSHWCSPYQPPHSFTPQGASPPGRLPHPLFPS